MGMLKKSFPPLPAAAKGEAVHLPMDRLAAVERYDDPSPSLGLIIKIDEFKAVQIYQFCTFFVEIFIKIKEPN